MILCGNHQSNKKSWCSFYLQGTRIHNCRHVHEGDGYCSLVLMLIQDGQQAQVDSKEDNTRLLWLLIGNSLEACWGIERGQMEDSRVLYNFTQYKQLSLSGSTVLCKLLRVKPQCYLFLSKHASYSIQIGLPCEGIYNSRTWFQCCKMAASVAHISGMLRQEGGAPSIHHLSGPTGTSKNGLGCGEEQGMGRLQEGMDLAVMACARSCTPFPQFFPLSTPAGTSPRRHTEQQTCRGVREFNPFPL